MLRRQKRTAGRSPRTLPVLHRPRRYARWRAATLAGVYLLFALHIAHWKIAGRTLAPLELNEVMYTLELGIVTAGFVFMAAAAVSVVIFGRFFCSWGCHILALEDLCAWLLGKVGIRPRPLRSRVLFFVPVAAFGYMFLWPQLERLITGRPLPQWRILTDADGWASFVTSDFWRNLPGPWITLLTFAICGFAIVYLLGSRSFCAYGCPYGVAFHIFDQLAPGRIVARSECQQCATCTAVCDSGIRVHEEIAAFGQVASGRCLKDLDCVAACPHGVLAYGVGSPPLFRSLLSSRRPRPRYDFSLLEDGLIAGAFVLTLLVFRGLYDSVPFLMTLGLGACVAFAAVTGWRLLRRSRVAVRRLVLKSHGRLTRSGYAAVAVLTLLAAFVGHSAFVRWHEYQAWRLFGRLQRLTAEAATPPPELLAACEAHLQTVQRWGLYRSSHLYRKLASIAEWTDRPATAVAMLDRVLEREPHDVQARFDRARLELALHRTAAAIADLRAVAASPQRPRREAPNLPDLRAGAHELLASLAAGAGRFDEAIRHLEQATREPVQHATAWLTLGELYARTGRPDEAIAALRRAVALAPDLAAAHYDLGVLLTAAGRSDEAIAAYQRAVKLQPADPQPRNNLAFLLIAQQRLDEAERHLRAALAVAPDYAAAHYNLARVLALRGDRDTALEHLHAAARLDPRYRQARLPQ